MENSDEGVYKWTDETHVCLSAEERPMKQCCHQRLSNFCGGAGDGICSKVFGPVAKQLNWCGRGEKRGIRKTNIGGHRVSCCEMPINNKGKANW